MKQYDLIRMIDQLAREIAAGSKPLNPDQPGFIPMQITFPAKSKYQFTREWYVAEYDWVHQAEVLEWCEQQFGPHPKNPDAWSRWQNNYSEKIHFRDAKDYHWFILRWSS